MRNAGNLSRLNLGLGLVRSLWMYRSHPIRSRSLDRLYRNFIHAGDLCFDIGSHIGNHLGIWLSLGARVVALEPQPHCLRLLRLLYGRRPGAILLEKAAGKEAGVQTLYLSRKSPTLSTLSPDWMQDVQSDPDFAGTKWDLRLPVEVTTLDELIRRYGRPVFCKIDVEGGELAVLQGLSVPLPALSFEYIASLKNRAFHCLHRLHELAEYEYNWTRGEGRPFHSAEWLDLPGIEEEMNRFCGRKGSGDIYARRKP